MTAFNVVRFRVKPGREDEFIAKHEQMSTRSMKGFLRGSLIKTGDRTYCLIGEWDSFDSIVSARPAMIEILDTFRDTLEDLGNGLGVTDPVSGEVVAELTAA
jgi:quinol monooxygenase YgiN